MKTDEDIGFFKKLALKFITFLQLSYVWDRDTYYKLCALHYKLYFGSEITDDVYDGSNSNYKRAAHKHACIYMEVNKTDARMYEHYKAMFEISIKKMDFEKNG